MRGLNLAVLIIGLTLVGAALYGFGSLDGSLKLAAAHAAPAPAAPITVLEEQPHGPCHMHDGGSATPGV